MATPQQIEAAIKKVQDQTSFINLLLKETLNWQIPEGIENIEDMAFTWASDELRADALDAKVVDGKVLQIQPFQQDQQWGIFLLEFKNVDAFVKGRGLTGPLRKVLRGLVRKKRQQANRPAWERENLLFICTHNYKHYRFAYFKAPTEKENTSPLAIFGWNHRDSEIRTLCQHNLPFLEWDKQSNWQQAFSIEKVTREFYKAYAAVFEAAEDYIAKANKGLKDDKMRLFTQMLFNRLMFLRFVEKKGWLKFGDGRDYLKNLFAAKGLKGKSFYKSRLCPLFFEGLAIENPNCRDAVGDVPFLNGGLFEMTDLDKDVSDIPDEAFKGIIGDDGLFYHFNFTVEESTPLDIEVAVDPEMLGKVFEELVTGRHESGSYYTPRPIVSFMCKEALKGFLCGKTSASKEAIEKLVDDHEVAQELTDFHAEEILYYLDTIKACDPACGSGAYLLGLLQELIAIRRTLQNERLLADTAFMYKLKLGIISRSLYGVDIDEFATNVAKLRLWLSLAVEAEKPQPLPNLDFKIETGDSVLGPCTPFLESEEALTMSALRERAKQLVLKKDRFMMAHGKGKRALFDEIRQEEATIAEETATVYGNNVIAWHIHFAEVFISGRRQQQIDRNIADIGDFKVTTIEPGGFDIVLANPPYLNMFEMDAIDPEYRERLRQQFATARGGFDVFVPFMERGVQLLCDNGMLAYITPNKLLSAKYADSLRKFFESHTQLRSLTDLSNVPVFGAAVYPFITVAMKCQRAASDAKVEVFTTESDSLDLVALKHVHSVPMSISQHANHSWSLLVDPNVGKLSVALNARLTLEVVATISASATVDEAYKWKDAIINDGSELRRGNRDRYIPFIVSGNIRPFYQTWETGNVRYLKTLYHQPVIDAKHSTVSQRRYDQMHNSKIVVSGMSTRPTCTWVVDPIASGVATILVFPRDGIDGAYLSGVINSETMARLYRVLFGSLSLAGGFMRFGAPQLKLLPIPRANRAEQQAVARLVEQCLDCRQAIEQSVLREIDERVSRLYGIT